MIELDYDSAGLIDEDLLDCEITYYTGNSEDILRNKDLEQLSVTVNTVVDHPLCANGHPMITMVYAGPGYVTGYVCDVCTGCSSEGHLEWTRDRWHCGECEYDVCFQCVPQRFTDEENVDMMWT